MFNWLFGLKCPDCGKRFRENEQYCPNCGANLDASNEQLSKEIAQQYLGKAKKAYDRGSRFKVALTNCDLAIQYDPDSARAHNLRGLILDAMGRTAEAILCYREAIRIDPLFEEAGENLKDAETERLHRPSEEKRASPSDGKWFTVILGMVGIITCIIVVGAALGGLYLLYRFGREYLGPKTTLTFEPDTSRISKADPSDLEKTAELLTERCQLLGYTQVSFVVTQDNKITGKVPGSIDAEALAGRIDAIGLLEFVDFGKTRIPEGTAINTDLEHKYIVQSGDTKWHTVMTNHEIETVSLGKDAVGRDAIDFTLTPKGSEIFYQYTTENIGSYLGIVLDKVVVSTPMVQGAIPDGQGQISGIFTKETAEELAVFLKMTPLPIPIKLYQEADSNK